MIKIVKRYFASLSIILIGSAAGPAQAVFAADAASTGGELTEIVVTAQRREENLQKAAVAITVLGADALNNAGITSHQDLTRIVPSVQISMGGGGSTQAFLRGVGNLTGNTYNEQAIAFNLDGVYLARGEAISGTFFDLERVEVLKGPQGTLYGRNATAGAINLITRKPVLGELGGDFEAQAGNHDAYLFEGALNVPTSEKSALRLAGQRVYHSGWLSDGYDDQDETDARVTWLWLPTDDLSVRLGADTSGTGGKGSANTYKPATCGFWTGPSEPCNADFYRANNVPPLPSNGYNNISSKGFSGQVDWSTEFGTLTVLPSYRQLHNDTLHLAAGFPVTFDQFSETKSFETRFALPSDLRVTGLVGLYYFDEQASYDLIANQSLLHPIPSPVNPMGVIAYDDIPAISTKAYAAFFQGAVKFTDVFRFVAGGRLSKEDKSTAGSSIVLDATKTFNPSDLAPFSSSLTAKKFTWKAGFEYDVAPASLLYLNVATGFKAGGFYVGEGGTYKPETLTAYTLGSKNRFIDNRLQINLEAYYWKYKDKQLSYFGIKPNHEFDLLTTNAGDVTLYGLETEVSFALTRHDMVSTTVAYEDTRYDRLTFVAPFINQLTTACPSTINFTGNPLTSTQTVNCSGYSVPNAPKWAATANFSHTLDLGNGGRLVGTIAGIYRSASVSGDEQLAVEHNGGYGTEDLTLSYQHPGDRWSVTAFVYNLTDREIFGGSVLSGFPGKFNPQYGQIAPRTYGMRFNTKF